jgi:hypothetical protein
MEIGVAGAVVAAAVALLYRGKWRPTTAGRNDEYLA